MALDVKRLLQLPNALKIPELMFAFIILIVHRKGEGGFPVSTNGIDSGIFSILTIYGFFVILLYLIVSIVMEDKTPVFCTLVAAFGFIFYLSAGSKIIVINNGPILESSKGLALGSLMIIQSFIFAGDAGLSGLYVLKDRS